MTPDQRFRSALTETLRHEGGFVDHPADPGGATNLGITQATLAAWRGRPVSVAEVRGLTRDEAAAIYRARYWNAVDGDRLPAGLDLALFDFAVNSGPSRAIRTLQAALGAKRDGRIGPETRAAIAAADPAIVLRDLCGARRAFLRGLSTFSVFGRGWMRRVDSVERVARTRLPNPSSASLSQPKGPTMDDTKSLLSSRTLWANLIGLAALALGAFGFDTSAIDAGQLSDQLLQAVAAVSFVASSVFRVIATRKLMG